LLGLILLQGKESYVIEIIFCTVTRS